jgi:hypothetical protein
MARRVRWGQVEGDSTKTEWGWRVAEVWIYGGLPRALVVITAVEAMFRVKRWSQGLRLYKQRVAGVIQSWWKQSLAGRGRAGEGVSALRGCWAQN